MKTPVAIFGRVSLDSMDFQRQISDLQKVADKQNYEVVSVITEKISGAKTNQERLGVQQLLEEAKLGKFKKVLCTEISRLGRSNTQTLCLIDELHELGISIYFQDLNSETLNEKGEVSFQTEILTNLLSLFAKNERQTLISRIRSGMQQAKANNIHCGRPKNSKEESEEFLSKYPKVIQGIKKGYSVRECVKLYDVSLGTVAKIRKMI
ncbi:DNA invertase Pin-like site-specific DNA recombinase [Flavobacterium gossypii]|uniref:DNA invertase Pin-like site-specific DNA recombinase n=1 Tax=Flavobacterium gossypii TaxID=1646119 RepID=A0ABR6DMB8_9FLAO|nr:recombinase family protein [Flavobacterium gossypii]MBA9072584.1 DNA invertase Pin-like site-specific DNA recombinase [Flavobacterium gossypii]